MVSKSHQYAVSGPRDNSLTAWERVVRAGVAGRKDGATDPEIRSLAKMLGRLEASAADAIRQTQLARADESAAQDFAAALEALGHD